MSDLQYIKELLDTLDRSGYVTNAQVHRAKKEVEALTSSSLGRDADWALAMGSNPPPAPPRPQLHGSDPFADVRDKRMSELTPEQKDRTYEQWARKEIGAGWPLRDVFEAMFRVIDRLRTALATQQAVQGEPVAWVTDADVACFGKGEKGEIVALLQKKAKWKHPLYAAPGQAERDKKDAERYRVWRDNMIARPPEFLPAMAAALPKEVGTGRRPTAVEWDAALDAIRAARSSKGGAA